MFERYRRTCWMRPAETSTHDQNSEEYSREVLAFYGTHVPKVERSRWPTGWNLEVSFADLRKDDRLFERTSILMARTRPLFWTTRPRGLQVTFQWPQCSEQTLFLHDYVAPLMLCHYTFVKLLCCMASYLWSKKQNHNLRQRAALKEQHRESHKIS